MSSLAVEISLHAKEKNVPKPEEKDAQKQKIFQNKLKKEKCIAYY